MAFDSSGIVPGNDLLANLIKSRAVISDPAKWCQGSRKDTHGRMCALGAVDHAVGKMWSVENERCVTALAAAVTREERVYSYPRDLFNNFCGQDYPENGDVHIDAIVASYNNTHSHDEVMGLFDRAIAREMAMVEMKELELA